MPLPAVEHHARRPWERWLALGLAAAVVLLHAWYTSASPVDVQVMRERGLIFQDPFGNELGTHIDWLVPHHVLHTCEGAWDTCLLGALAAADHHHPPVAAWAYLAWAQLVGADLYRVTWLNLGWLALTVFAVASAARRHGGPHAAWVAALLTVACPVVLGPTRGVNPDVAQVALMTAFGLGCLRVAEGPGLRWVGVGLVGALALLTKWEALMGLLGAGVAAGVFAAGRSGRVRAVLRLGGVAAVCYGGVRLYLEGFFSYSFWERPQLQGLLHADFLLAALGPLLGSLGPDVQAPPVPPGDVLTVGALFAHYTGALAASSAGLLVTTCLGVGAVMLAVRRRWGLLVWAASWAAVSLLAVMRLAPGFADDRFIYFFLPGLLVAGAVGLAGIPRPGWVLAGVGVVAALQVWDVSVVGSPLPRWPALRLGGEDDRVLGLRVDDPVGHPWWHRPERRVAVDLDGIDRVLEAARGLGAARVMPALRRGEILPPHIAWYAVALARGDVLVREGVPRVYASEMDGCRGLDRDAVLGLFAPRTVLVVPAAGRDEGAALGAIDWSYETCNTFQSPEQLGVEAVSAGLVEMARGPVLLVALRVAAPPPPP